MASFLIPNWTPLTLPVHATPKRAAFKPLHVPISRPIRFAGDGNIRRGLAVITRAGPSTSTYVFAFLFPFSMLLGTIIVSIRIADKLDRDYLEELVINQAIREADEDDDDDDEGEDEGEDENDISLEDEVLQPALQGTKTRNRPKRGA